MTRSLWRKAAPAIFAAAGLGAISLFLLLQALDHGLLNGAIQRLASAKTGRSVRFRTLKTHLLSAQPTFTIEGLVIGSPPAITHDDLAHIPRMTGRLDMAPLLMGKLQVRELTLLKPDLHLTRLGPGRNNFSFGSDGSSGALRYTQRLTIVGGRVHYENSERHLTMDGAFAHDGRPGLAKPFELHAVGVSNGESYVLEGAGGPLNGRAPGAPYAISADLRDGSVLTRLVGTTGAPFEFGAFDFRFVGSGPNLADYGYLFGGSTPNSPPFSLTGVARRRGQLMELSDISGHVGRSDVRGTISSTRGPSMSRSIRATIVSRVIYLGDARALLAARPGHALTRLRSGAVGAAGSSTGRIFSDQPFRVDALRSKDIAVDLKAAKVADAPFPMDNLFARLAIKNGQIALSPFSVGTAPGRLEARMQFDSGRSGGTAAISGFLTGARLGALGRNPDSGIDGDVDLWFDVHAQGASPHAMAADTRGRVAFRLQRGRLQRYKAAALAGDLVEAVGLALGNRKSSEIPLSCAVGEFVGKGGRFQVSRLDIVTGAGATDGEGAIDLGGESLSVVLRGRPTQKRLLQLSPPITVEGPLLHPAVKTRVAAALRRAGPVGLIALVTAPLAALPPLRGEAAAGPSCDPLLARAAAFVKGR